MNIFFGTDGWRAYIDSEINETSVMAVAQAFAGFVKARKKDSSVAVGYDTRRNSMLFATVFAKVLSGNGIVVWLADRVTPTPVLSHATRHRGCSAGVMITASHNPAGYNGIKFKSSLGGPFSSEDTKKVEALLYKDPVLLSEENIRKVNFIPDYVAALERIINFKAIRKARLPLLVDSMGGAGLRLTEQILRNHGCPVKTIYGEPSETFYGRLAEPIEKNLAPLKMALKEGAYAFGVATDGDADRVGVCLDTGEWLSVQDTILLLVNYLKRIRKLPGGIVKTSSVTDKIRVLFESAETPVYEVQVGFKYIADLMNAEEIAFGGEESGGFGYGIHIPERDGVFSSLLLLEMLSSSSFCKMSDYFCAFKKETGEICYDRIDDHYDKSDKNRLLPELYADLPTRIGDFRVEKTLPYLSSREIINGLKFVFDGGCRWLLIRSSETENIIRYYAEGHTRNEVKQLLMEGKELLRNVSEKLEKNG